MIIIILALYSKASEEIRKESTENRRFRQLHWRLTPPLQGTPANIPKKLILPETRVTALHQSSFKLLWWAPRTHIFRNRVRTSHSRSSEVVDFGTNRKRVCDFLWSYPAPFQRYCWFSAAPHPKLELGLDRSPTLFHAKFGGVPFRLDRWRWAPMSEDFMLIFRVISFELTQPIWSQYINVTNRQRTYLYRAVKTNRKEQSTVSSSCHLSTLQTNSIFLQANTINVNTPDCLFAVYVVSRLSSYWQWHG